MVELSVGKVILIVVTVAIIFGLLGGIIGSVFFAKQGQQGIQGLQGEIGPQGLQGIPGLNGTDGTPGLNGTDGAPGLNGADGAPGLNGTDSILQIIRNQNTTPANLGLYNLTQWYNISVLDASMRLTINIRSQSRILAEFVGTVNFTNSEIWLRIIVDNQINGVICYAGLLGPNAPVVHMPVQVKILTDALSAGTHTVQVQFYRSSGLPILLDRSLYVSELTAP